jgi:hypothetical protein
MSIYLTQNNHCLFNRKILFYVKSNNEKYIQGIKKFVVYILTLT